MNLRRKLFNIIRTNNNVELISIHIPKTAGTSLKNILQFQYPGAIELIYDNNLNKNKLMWKGSPIKLDHKGVKCIMGHFPAKQNLKKYYPNAKIITWMRDPVERMISTYNFYKQMPIHHNKIHNQFIIENWDIITLSHELKQETKSYMGDFSLNDFNFIGFIENQKESLFHLGQLMNWKKLNTNIMANIGKSKVIFNEDIREKLKAILVEETEIYNEAKNLFMKNKV